MIFYKEKFRQLRESRGLTHEEIGAACGVSQSIVSRWEKKGKSQPRPAKIKKIAAILQCKESDLVKYGDTDTPEPPPVNKLLFYRERSGITRSQLAKKIGVEEYIIEAWENFSQTYDSNFDSLIQDALGLSDEQMLEINSDVFTIANQMNNAKREYRALLRGESFRTINNAYAEAFRKKAIETIITLDIEPSAKDAVLQVINKL